jgi:hypothetical protein
MILTVLQPYHYMNEKEQNERQNLQETHAGV